jgi:putative transposase
MKQPDGIVTAPERIGSMATRRRHTALQIASKLAMADEMAADGRLHGDIAKSLGVSVMTYHRWRKARGSTMRPDPRRAMNGASSTVPYDRDSAGDRNLQHENSRLRRLVADLLLEKMKLEEDLRGAFSRQSVRR